MQYDLDNAKTTAFFCLLMYHQHLKLYEMMKYFSPKCLMSTSVWRKKVGQIDLSPESETTPINNQERLTMCNQTAITQKGKTFVL